MINVTIHRNDNDSIYGVTVKGHSENAIVCNSVSVITQMPILGMEWQGYTPTVKTDKEAGFLEVIEDEAVSYYGGDCCVMTLWQAMLAALKSLQKQYPEEVKLEGVRKHE